MSNFNGFPAGQQAYDNAVNPIDEQVSPWDSLTQDQCDDIERDCLGSLAKWGQAELFGCEITYWDNQELDNIAGEAEEELGEDWLTECLETPYSTKHGEYKEKLWDAFCNAVDEGLIK
jgi:hypothetical protein